MKLSLSPKRTKGFSLLLVMFLLGVGFLIMTGALRWSEANGTLTERYGEYYTSRAAAEAATEKVVSTLARDFQNGGVAGVDANLSGYGSSYPTSVEMTEWGQYEFRNPEGGNNSTYVVKLSNEVYTPLNWKYSGFGGYAASYRIVSNARQTASGNNIVGVRQDVQAASIPVFEFAVFYAMDMEMHPLMNDWQIGGRVHGNANIYCKPYNPRNVTFKDHITAAGKILHQNHPNDPTTRVFGSVTFLGERDTGVTSLNLPIGTNNTPQALHRIIEIPPSPDATTVLGKQRYYNKANLIIRVTNTNAAGISGATGLTISWPVVNRFVDINKSFYDKRWAKTVRLIEIDVDKLRTSGNYQDVRDELGGLDPKIIYVADLRTDASDQFAVRLINARILPTPGLTVATMNPLYVRGHFNAPDLATTNTVNARPASLVCDAITILSDNWDDNRSTDPLSGGGSVRTPPLDTTINAAVIAGIVPSNGTYYSGGVECYFRLLQDWYGGAKVLTFNGSIVALYHSQIATSPWGGNDVYLPPIRNYAFDVNFKDPLKLPPGTPQLRALIRSEWTAARANSTL